MGVGPLRECLALRQLDRRTTPGRASLTAREPRCSSSGKAWRDHLAPSFLYAANGEIAQIEPSSVSINAKKASVFIGPLASPVAAPRIERSMTWLGRSRGRVNSTDTSAGHILRIRPCIRRCESPILARTHRSSRGSGAIPVTGSQSLFNGPSQRSGPRFSGLLTLPVAKSTFTRPPPHSPIFIPTKAVFPSLEINVVVSPSRS